MLASCNAGSSFGVDDPIPGGMTESIGLAILVAVAAVGAGVGCVTAFGAGGRRHDSLIRMLSGSRDRLEGHVAVIKQCGLFVQKSVVGNKRIAGLIGSHTVAPSADDVLEGGGFFEIMCQQSIYHGFSVLNEAAVGIGIDTPSCARNNDPRTAFGAFRIERRESAVFVLHLGKALKRLFTSGGNCFLITIRIQRL